MPMTSKLKKQGILAAVLLTSTMAGCASRAPYFLIESRLVESSRYVDAPDVTETPTFRSVRGGVRTIGLRPPDVCADQGLTTSGGSAELQLGVLRTRCGVEMAEFERALARVGYEVVSWGALQQLSTKLDKPLLESANQLGIDVLLQVNSLERIEIQPGRDARIERRFFRAMRNGERAESTRVKQSRAREFESLIAGREASLAGENRVGATINVSAVWVESGATIWFYEATQVDRVGVEPRVEVLADCDGEGCREIFDPAVVASDGPVEGSISAISQAGDPVNESQAIFHGLVRRLATDLAERLAGRNS